MTQESLTISTANMSNFNFLFWAVNVIILNNFFIVLQVNFSQFLGSQEGVNFQIIHFQYQKVLLTQTNSL